MTDILKKSNSRQRLAAARQAAQKVNESNKTAVYTWRNMRQKVTGDDFYFGPGLNTDSYGRKTPIWYCFNEESIPAVSVQFADEVYSGIKHCGWFADDDQMRGTIRGVVCRLEGKRWIVGYYWSDNGEYVIRQDEIFTDIEDAAIAADRFAEDYAEVCREDARKFQKANEINDKIEMDIKRLLECLALRHNKKLNYIREEITELIDTIRDSRKALKEYSDYL
jgi:hypothetical protein